MPGRMTRLHTLNAIRTHDEPQPRLKPRGLPPALAPHGVWAAANPAEAALYGRDLLGTHRVHIAGRDVHAFAATFHGTLIRDVTLGYLDYSTAVRVEVHELSADQLVIVPASGTSTLHVGDHSIAATPVTAAVPRPGSPMTLTCDDDAAHLVVRIQHGALELHLSRLLGRTLDRPLEFAPVFDLSAPSSSRWNFAVQMLHAELYDRNTLLHRGVGLGQLEEFLMSSLLYCQPSNYTDLLTTVRRSERQTVRTARDFIDRNLSRPITVAEIAGAAGVSVRTLQNQFAEDLDQTLTGYLKNRRLDRARADLADTPPGTGVGVTDIATRWGFTHLGRFAVTYRARFGETPSQTLRG
jgi:AraC-like DNA-binding protein